MEVVSPPVVRVRRAGMYGAAALWVVWLVVPTHAGGLVNGVPLGAVETLAAAAIVWLIARGRAVRGGAIVAAAAVAAFAVALAVPAQRGFRARYFANAAAEGSFEQSTDFLQAPYTRIDDRLEFAPGRAEFPLAFFNDANRFNFNPSAERDRDHLPFAVVWEGQWWIPRGKTARLFAEAPDASAEIVLDGVRVVSTAGEPATVPLVALPAGWHRLDIRFTSPAGGLRRFAAGEIDKDRRVPFDGGSVFARRLPAWQLAIARATGALKTVVDAAALAYLAWLLFCDLSDLRRGRSADGATLSRDAQILWWFAAVAIVDAYVAASPWLTRVMVLTPGDDPLTYETYARLIQLKGPLLRDVDGPFYYQVLYPYLLAGMHWLFGEGMFGMVFVQRLLVAFLVWMLVRIAVAIAGERVLPAALIAAAAIAYGRFVLWVGSPSTESVFVPLLIAWTAATVALCLRPTPWRAAAVGALGGIAALTRTTALLACLSVVPAMWIAWRGRPQRGRMLALFVGCTLALLSLIAIRNWIVVHRFVPMPTEFAVTLLGGNEPPAGLVTNPVRARWYEWAHLDPAVSQVLEFAIGAPAAFAAHLARKAAFAIGWYEPYAPGWGFSTLFLANTALAAIGAMLALRLAVVPPAVALVPALVSLAHFAAVVLVYPKSDRMILPHHLLWSLYSAIALNAFARRAARAIDAMTDSVGRAVHRAAPIAGAAVPVLVGLYLFAIRTRGVTDHFLMLTEQMRDWSIALGPFSRLPLVGTPSTAGGNSLGPVYYWVLWLSRVAIGPWCDNLPHAGGIGIAALQSIADVVLCFGIRRVSGSWIFAAAAVLIIGSSPFDVALSSVIWNPPVAVAFAKMASGLFLSWGADLTRPRRMMVAALAWFAVQAHSAALPFAAAIFLSLFVAQWRRGWRVAAVAAIEMIAVVALLQVPSAVAPASVRPSRALAVVQAQRPDPAAAFRAITASIEAIGFAPATVPQTPLLVIAATTAVAVTVGAIGAVGAVAVMPIVMAVGVWSVWQQQFDQYWFLTLVPGALLAMAWTTRLLPSRTTRAALAAALLVSAVAVQRPRIENSALVFRMPEYGALVKGSREIVKRGVPVRRIDVPFLHPFSDSTYVYTLLGGQLRPDADAVATLSTGGEVSYGR